MTKSILSRDVEDAVRYRRSSSVLFSELHGEWLAIDAEAGFCYSLNETGGLVWEALARPVTVSEICDAVSRTFDVQAGECRSDVREVLDQLRTSGLVEVVGPEPMVGDAD